MKYDRLMMLNTNVADKKFAFECGIESAKKKNSSLRSIIIYIRT